MRLVDADKIRERLFNLKCAAFAQDTEAQDALQPNDYDNPVHWLSDCGWSPRWVTLSDAIDVVMSDEFLVK